MPDLVALTIDDRQVQMPPGTLVVDAAKRFGTDIPVFCYHPKMAPVGMCRMCLVEIGRPAVDRATRQPILNADGTPRIDFGPKLETACTVPVSPGMAVRTTSEKVKAARDDVIEFLLTSHPLDCPICDKGGECPLQNLTLAHGPGVSRFLYDEKLHLAKRFPLGSPEDALIYLDRERCIQCGRCTRFSDEIADDHVLGFFQRGRGLEIVTFSEPGFDSKFSGNTTDICPVGALTTADFRFRARPWELTPAASVCTHCPVGCNTTLSVRREVSSGGGFTVKRVLPRQNEQVNEIWICDKGRFGYHYAVGPDRLEKPLIREHGRLVEASWEKALGLVAEKFRAAGGSLVGIAGDRLSNEDLFNFRKLVEGLGGQTTLHSPMGGGNQVQQVGAGVGTNFKDMGKGTAILVVACDLEEEAPIWWLRVKQAAERGATLIVTNGRSTKTDRAAAHSIRYNYGDESATVSAMLFALTPIKQLGLSERVFNSLKQAGISSVSEVLDLLGRGQEAVLSILKDGKKGLKEGKSAIQLAAEAFASAENAVLLFGSEGLDFAGTSALAQACANLLIATGHYGKPNNGLIAVWPHGNTQGAWDMGVFPNGRSVTEATAGMKAAYIVGANPVGEGDKVRAEFAVVQDLYLTETARIADVVLPAQSFVEREGTFTSGERRVQRFYPGLPPRGVTQADWQIAAEIGHRAGLSMTHTSAAAVMLEIARQIPAYTGITYQELAKVEKQWPDVGGADLYYGGTSYENRQGLGVQLKSGAERAETPTLGQVEPPPSPTGKGLRLAPVTRLYDRGETFAKSEVMHARLPEPFVELNPADALRLGVRAGDRVRVALPGGEVELRARVASDTAVPEGVALMPRSLGVPAPTHTVLAELSKAQ